MIKQLYVHVKLFVDCSLTLQIGDHPECFSHFHQRILLYRHR